VTTAVEDDKLLPRNPCRIKGAGTETAAERPVLTVGQVFELAELVGRRPVGNVRKLPGGGYQLRVQRHGEMRTVPEVYETRAAAEAAMWLMASEDRADCAQDRRYRITGRRSADVTEYSRDCPGTPLVPPGRVPSRCGHPGGVMGGGRLRGRLEQSVM
jgi:hypothetical protein